MSPETVRRVLWVLALVGASACRKGTERTDTLLPVMPAPAGTQGCAPAAATATATSIFNSALFGPKSQIAAATGTVGADTLFWTALDGGIHELTVPNGGGAASDAVVLAPGVIDTDYLQPAGIGAQAELSGIAVLDDALLAVAEHASNTLLLVDRVAPTTVTGLAGLRDPGGGFASGTGGSVRFHFTDPVPLFVDGAGFLYVGDTGNHAVRQVEIGGVPSVTTIAGSGAAGAGETVFDTPSGFAASCGGDLLVVESGAAGVGGNVLKSLQITASSFLSTGIGVSGLVLAGDGTNATTEGVDGAAQLGTPVALASTDDGRVLWIDAVEAVLRRYDFATGLTDCPMFSDCASAVAAASPFVGTGFSLALGESGTLYVLATSGAGGTIWRVDP